MDRDGTPRSPEGEDPLKPAGSLGSERHDHPEQPDGDVLSDGWTPGHASGHGPGDAAEHAPERARPEDGGWDAADDAADEGLPGFLGSGWTREDQLAEEQSSKNGRLILAMIAIVLLAVSGGWIVSSSVGARPEAACAAADRCDPAGLPAPDLTDGPAEPAPSGPATVPASVPATPTDTPTAQGETVRSPSGAPVSAPPSDRSRVTQQPPARPAPSRTVADPPRTSPRSSISPPRPDSEVTDEPQRTPPPSPAPAPTTEEPEPAPSPTKTKSGGLLDWLF